MTVTLRPFAEGDADALFEWMRDPESVRVAVFTWRDPDDRALFDAWLARNLANPTVRHWSIDADGAYVGMTATFEIEGAREITYWVDRAHWGWGIASAAVGEVLKRDATRPLGARAASTNLGSIAVLEHNGFVEVGRERAGDVEETVFRLD
jgi:RimJ/RimL family protein N-acetyltransferase